MGLHHAASGEVIELKPYGEKLADAVSAALFKTQELEVMRLVLQAGREVPEHRVAGEMTIQCLEGEVELRLRDGARILRGGHLACLDGNSPYSFHAKTAASLLLTIVLKHADLSQGAPK